VLDRSWSPLTIRDAETDTAWPARIPATLRPAEAHLLLDRGVSDATRAIEGALNDANTVEVATTAAGDVVGVLRQYGEHFPGREADAVLDALIESSLHGRPALGAVLRAWGAPDQVVKHTQRSVARAKRVPLPRGRKN
jgi:hypothetical protein